MCIKQYCNEIIIHKRWKEVKFVILCTGASLEESALIKLVLSINLEMMQIIWGIEEHGITWSFLCTDKPRITLEPSPLNILLGSSKQLRCIVSANPVVSRVRWQKDTQTLTSKKDFFFSFSFSEIPGKYISFVKFYNIITCGIFFFFHWFGFVFFIYLSPDEKADLFYIAFNNVIKYYTMLQKLYLYTVFYLFSKLFCQDPSKTTNDIY